MNKIQKASLLVLSITIFIQLRISYLGVNPVSFYLPELPILQATNQLTGNVEIIGKNDLIGPESMVTSRHQGINYMFLALGDGRIVRMTQASNGNKITKNNNDRKFTKEKDLEWTTLVSTGHYDEKCGSGGPDDSINMESYCGRPLGLTIVKHSTVVDPSNITSRNTTRNDEDVLIVADSYHGLLMVDNIYRGGDDSNKYVLATRAKNDEENYRFHLLNGVVQTPDKSLYFTETSNKFSRRRIFHAVFDGNATGRLLKYTPHGGVEVMKDGIYMANGITLSHDKKSLLVVSGVQILQYDLEADEMKKDPFVSVMPGTGDNIKVFNQLPNGEKVPSYWAGLGSKYAQPKSLLKLLCNKPKLRSILVAILPYKKIINLIPKLSAFAVYDVNGNLIDTYQDSLVLAPWLSEGEPFGDYIYLGSWYNPFLARVNKRSLSSS